MSEVPENESKSCLKVEIGRDACYLQLVRTIHHPQRITTGPIGHTSDGDWVLIDYDENGKIVGLELIGDKPCQR